MSRRCHHRDCALKLLEKQYPDQHNVKPEFVYCSPHGLGTRDISGMWDVDIWLPDIGKNIRVACSSHKNMRKTIKEHNLTNKNNYIFNSCFEYYLVTWQVKKHKMLYTFYRLPNVEEI